MWWLIFRFFSPTSIISTLFKLAFFAALVGAFVYLGGMEAMPLSSAGVGVAAAQEMPDETPEDPREQVQREQQSNDEQSQEQSEQTDEEAEQWNSVIEEIRGLNVHAVEYDRQNDVARIYLSADRDVDGITITDGTRTETGYANRMQVSLSEGERQVYELELFDASNEHLSIDFAGRLWLHFGGSSDLRVSDSVDYPLLLSPGAMGVTVVLLLGLHYYSRRDRYEAINPLT